MLLEVIIQEAPIDGLSSAYKPRNLDTDANWPVPTKLICKKPERRWLRRFRIIICRNTSVYDQRGRLSFPKSEAVLHSAILLGLALWAIIRHSVSKISIQQLDKLIFLPYWYYLSHSVPSFLHPSCLHQTYWPEGRRIRFWRVWLAM